MPEDGAPDESRESQPQEAGNQGSRRESEDAGQPDGPEGTSGRRKPDAWPPEELEEEQKAQAGTLSRRQRRRTRRSAQAERVGHRKAGDEIYSRCEIVNDESARGFGLWRFRFWEFAAYPQGIGSDSGIPAGLPCLNGWQP
jgi:hypothetical protein